MKKGKKRENRSESEARDPTVFTAKGVFQHPARVTFHRNVALSTMALLTMTQTAREATPT